jgi:hypothetical protein
MAKTLTATVSNTVSIIKSALLNLSASVSSLVTITLFNILSKILTVTSTTTASIDLLRAKILSVVSTATTTLNKQMYVVFSIISATIASVIVAVFERLGAVTRYTFIIDMKDRLAKASKYREILMDSSRKKVEK